MIRPPLFPTRPAMPSGRSHGGSLVWAFAVLLLPPLLLSPAPARAADPPPAATATTGAQTAPTRPIDCNRTEVEAELIICADRDLTANQKKLDAVIRRGGKQVPARALPLFEAAQKAWVAYRDAECAWNAHDLDTGATNALARLTCLSDLTANRIDELEASIGGR